MPAAELFADAQHPSIAGYLLMAEAYAAIIAQQFDTPIVQPLRDANDAAVALDVQAEDLGRSFVHAGSWLVATAVGHPLPRDRMALAVDLFQRALGKEDDFSAWFGLGLAQAALRGALRTPDELTYLCRHTKSYRFSVADVSAAADRLEQVGVDPDVVQHIRTLGTSDILQ
jgi:hypothetical protein